MGSNLRRNARAYVLRHRRAFTLAELIADGAFQALAAALPATALWLLVAGGVAYSAGVIFHLWEKLAFQNVLWHAFVVTGATLHLIAIFEAMVLIRM